MNIAQVTGHQAINPAKIEQGQMEQVEDNASVSSRVEVENKKAAESDKTTDTEVERIQDEIQKAQIKDLVEQMNKSLDPLKTSLKFGFHDISNTYYVSVVDTNTNDIIRTFPSEEAMQLSVKMKEFVGMIFDQKG